MRILQINKFFYPKGGSETYYFSLCNLLEKHKHDVVHFSMQDNKNENSPYKDYFVSHLNITKPQVNLSSIGQISRLIWSNEAQKKLEQLLTKEKIDIAHLHNIDRHLTPSIIPVLKKHKIPVVMTLHDYKIICPNSLLFANGEICERCKGRKFYSPFPQKCIKQSRSISLIGSFEAYYHLWRKVWKKVDLFISPSQFLKQKMQEFGVSQEKITYLPLFLEGKAKKITKSTSKGYFLYFGRLSPEKGVKTLMEVFSKLPQKTLKIAGSGPQEEELKMIAKDSKNIEFLGFQDKKAIKRLLTGAKGVIISSIWFENAPYTIMEAMWQGKVVLGSRVGGIPELIDDQKSGLLFNPSNIQDLMSKIEFLEKYPAKLVSFGSEAKKRAEALFNEEDHYQRLIQIYQKVS